MATTTGSKSRVVDGPCKKDLHDSLAEGQNVTFTIHGLGQQRAVVNSIALEDGSHQRWVVGGYLVGFPSPWPRFYGYYETRRRSGMFEVSGIK